MGYLNYVADNLNNANERPECIRIDQLQSTSAVSFVLLCTLYGVINVVLHY